MRICALLMLLIYALPALADTATVVEGVRVNLRSGKLDTSRVLRALEPGTEVEVLRQEPAFVQVKTSEGDVGWLPLRLVKITVTPPKAPAPNPTLEALKAEIAQAQADLKQSRNSNTLAPAWVLLAVGLGGLMLGILLGMGGLQAYYRKKLNGLRI